MAHTLRKWIAGNAGKIGSRAGVCLLLAGIATGYYAINDGSMDLTPLLPIFFEWFIGLCVVATLIHWSVVQNAFNGAVERFGKKFAKHI